VISLLTQLEIHHVQIDTDQPLAVAIF